MVSKDIKIGNIHEKYDSPYAELVQTACAFSSEIHLECGTKKVNGKSIMGIIAFEADEGDTITVYANGADENDAVAAIEKFLTCK